MATLRPYLAPLSWMVLTLGLYAIPGQDMPSNGFWDVLSLDKVGHIGIFAVLCCTWMIAFRKQRDSNYAHNHAMWFAVGLSSVYGALLEWMQGAAFEERTSEWMDLLANIVGVACGVLLFRLIYRKC